MSTSGVVSISGSELWGVVAAEAGVPSSKSAGEGEPGLDCVCGGVAESCIRVAGFDSLGRCVGSPSASSITLCTAAQRSGKSFISHSYFGCEASSEDESALDSSRSEGRRSRSQRSVRVRLGLVSEGGLEDCFEVVVGENGRDGRFILFERRGELLVVAMACVARRRESIMEEGNEEDKKCEKEWQVEGTKQTGGEWHTLMAGPTDPRRVRAS